MFKLLSNKKKVVFLLWPKSTMKKIKISKKTFDVKSNFNFRKKHSDSEHVGIIVKYSIYIIICIAAVFVHLAKHESVVHVHFEF
jgi:hypothetical protein